MSQIQNTYTQLLRTWQRLWTAAWEVKNVVWGPGEQEEKIELHKETESVHYQRRELSRELELLEAWIKEVDESPVQHLNEVVDDGDLAPFLQRNLPDHPLDVHYEELARNRERVATESVPDCDWPDKKTQDWWENNKGWFVTSHDWSQVSDPRGWFDGMGIPKRIAYQVIPPDVV